LGVRLLFVVASISGLALSCRPVSPVRLFDGMERASQWVMGTKLTVALPASRAFEARARAKLFDEVFAIAREWDDVLSDYNPQSPLSRLSDHAGRGPTKIDPRLFAFLRRALDASSRTEGAFDLTVGAIVRAARSGKLDAASLSRARATVGWRYVVLNDDGAAEMRRAGARLDAGGVGKGWAVDAIAKHLRRRGVERAFVDFGGSTFLGLGAPPGRRGWPVLLESAEPGRSLGVVWLRDEALSSSKSLPDHDRGKSVARGHIVNPRTGAIIEEARFAAVVSPSATDTEILTKPLVIDPSQQAKLVARFAGARSIVHVAGHEPRADAAMQKVWTATAPLDPR
jgi:thiamine biosynthesis lipoprotein